jgi:peptidoglycan/xylan/chitin deacetylase (PgdA/CDA1 family)
MEVVARSRRAVSLTELAARVAARESVHGMVAVTLDDGYADNVTEAAPILERFGVPATFFVTSRRDTDFWWDRLERLLTVPALPPQMTIESLDLDFRDDAGPSGPWTFYDDSDSSPRHVAFRKLYRLLHDHGEQLQERVLGELESQIGTASPLPARMTDEQIAGVAAHPLFAIGSHSRTHPVLSLLDAAGQSREIAGSKSELEAITGSAVTAFAYPYGTPWTFTAESVALARGAAYEHAVTASPALIGRRDDRFTLPRIAPRSGGGDELQRTIRWLR